MHLLHRRGSTAAGGAVVSCSTIGTDDCRQRKACELSPRVKCTWRDTKIPLSTRLRNTLAAWTQSAEPFAGAHTGDGCFAPIDGPRTCRREIPRPRRSQTRSSHLAWDLYVRSAGEKVEACGLRDGGSSIGPLATRHHEAHRVQKT